LFLEHFEDLFLDSNMTILDKCLLLSLL